MPDALERLKAALADRYRIQRELGAGGMATVYLAEDLKHHRKVAVKVLRPDLAASLGPERFLREVTIAANLTHPHILPLHDSGEADGFLYYVMPYVEGTSLRQKLLREGELPIPDAVRILRDVADAMAYAHQQGVVHRDIKPENVMLSGRHALVTDFGVAKAVSEATGRQTLTTAGVALGTPAYMAPEQAAADPHTDHRADLYAFGVVAYELLTGRPPFTGASPQAVLAAHVTTAADPVTKFRASIPPALAALVMRCLEKKPADRWQSAEELIPSLEAVLTPSGGMTPAQTQPVTAVRAAGPRPRWVMPVAAVVVVGAVAAGTLWVRGERGQAAPAGDGRAPVVVVPFEVRATDPALKDLSAQAADQLTAAIEQAGIGAVVPYRVTGESEAFSPELAERVVKATGAATLVTGIIAQRGDSVEIQAKVVRGWDLQTIWSLGPAVSSAAAPAEALNTIRERVLGAVGIYLSPNSTGANMEIYQPPPTLEIFRLSDRAGGLFRRGNPAEGIPLMVEAFGKDTTWLAGANRLSVFYSNAVRIAERDSVVAFVEARRERLSRGDALILDWFIANYRGSPEEEYRAAMAHLAADSSTTYDAMYSALRDRRPAEALRYFQRRDTSSAWGREWQAWDAVAAEAHHMLGQFEEALTLARAAKAREPRAYAHWESEARALGAMGRTAELETLISESHSLEDALAPGLLMGEASLELQRHGREVEARLYCERAIVWAGQVKAEGRWDIGVRNTLRIAYRCLGKLDEVRRLYAEEARRGASLAYRGLAMRDAVVMGDTAGALALVDSMRTAGLEVFRETAWDVQGAAGYYAAQILALLGRKDEAVALFREALNRGWRVGSDEALQWYWAPIKDYPPFVAMVKNKT